MSLAAVDGGAGFASLPLLPRGRMGETKEGREGAGGVRWNGRAVEGGRMGVLVKGYVAPVCSCFTGVELCLQLVPCNWWLLASVHCERDVDSVEN